MTSHLSVTIWMILAAICLTKITDATGDCSNPVPGIRKMAKGVDITRLDLLPLDIQEPFGFKYPVVNLTCHKGRKWTDRRNEDVYELPDQIWQINSLPGGYLEAETKIYRSYQDVRTQMNIDVGANVDFLFFSFSSSLSYKKMQNDIINSSKVIADVGAFDSATQAAFVPSWPGLESPLELDQFAKAYVDLMLLEPFESNPAAYNEFIQMFGTHYFATAKYGGFIRSFHEIASSYARSVTNTTIEAQAKASFFKIVTLHGGFASESTEVNEEFRQSTTVTTRYYGGYTNLLAEDGIQQWQPTVYKDPWLFSGTLKPISDLILDSSKRLSMIKAVTTYVLKSYLDELDRLLATVTDYNKRSMKNNLVSKVEELREKVVLTEQEVKTLDEEIHDLIHLFVTQRPIQTATRAPATSRPSYDNPLMRYPPPKRCKRNVPSCILDP